MRMFYFGPYARAGHFYYGPGGASLYHKEEQLIPWKYPDGILQQNCVIKFMRWEHGQEIEGQALVHYRDGWTALSFWDRTVDTRGACNSTYFADQILSINDMCTEARNNFRTRWDKMPFVVLEAEHPNNSLLCAKVDRRAYPTRAHVPTITNNIDADTKIYAPLNVCGNCNSKLAQYRGQWVSIDRWSEHAIAEGKTLDNY